jgi:phage anti-repressor protein
MMDLRVVETGLVPVYETEGRQVVNARELHEFLGVGKDFSPPRTRRRSEALRLRNERIWNLYHREGKTPLEIHKITGISKHTVAKVLQIMRRELHIAPSRRWPARDGGEALPVPEEVRVPEFVPGKLYWVRVVDRVGRSQGDLRALRFLGFVPGAEGRRHALFRHPAAGYLETFFPEDLAMMKTS